MCHLAIIVYLCQQILIKNLKNNETSNFTYIIPLCSFAFCLGRQHHNDG